jgi:histidinol-phosphate/aromatic aminotransferase/cobyric acid decarboxylase-like protein
MLPIWQESMKGMLRNCNFVSFVEPTVNFILCKLQNSNITSTQLAEATAERGLLIRDGSNFSGLDSRWFRLAIRTEEENKKAIDILKEAWGSLREQEE